MKQIIEQMILEGDEKLLNERKEILVRRRLPYGMLQSMLEVPNDKWVENKEMLTKGNLGVT